jgi:hypothetical protein
MSNLSNELSQELEHRLGVLAMRWRSLHSAQNSEAAVEVVEEYHKVMGRLWALGWDGEGLLPDSELPDRLMPEYFLQRWRK